MVGELYSTTRKSLWISFIHLSNFILQLTIENEPKLYWEVFWYLLRNEYAQVQPNLELAIIFLVRNVPFSITEKIVAVFFSDRDDRYRYLRTEKRRRIEILCDRAEQIKKRWGQLSHSFIQLLVILAALEPMEPELFRYEKYVLSEEIIGPLRNECSEELQSALMDLEEKQRLKHENQSVFFYDMGDLG